MAPAKSGTDSTQQVIVRRRTLALILLKNCSKLSCCYNFVFPKQGPGETAGCIPRSSSQIDNASVVFWANVDDGMALRLGRGHHVAAGCP